MTLVGEGPIDGDDADMYFGARVASTERRIRAWVNNFERITKPTSGFLGSLLALRAFLPEIRGFGVPAKSEVEEWRVAYLKWHDATINRWDDPAVANEVRQRTLSSLQELHAGGINMPKCIWAGNVYSEMKVFLHEFTGSNLGFDNDECQEVARHIESARRTVRMWASKSSQIKRTDNGFMASVFSLRLLVEAAPYPRKFTLANSEVDDWQETYLDWFRNHIRGFPKKIDPLKVKNRSLEEFRRLRVKADDLPKSAWESDVYADLAEVEFEEQQRRTNLDKFAAEQAQPSPQQLEWQPCSLHSLYKKDGTASHFLSFRQFDKCESAMKKRGVPNDGRPWQGIVKCLLTKSNSQILEKIKISRQSAMFRAESDSLDALRAIRDLVRAVLIDDRLLDEGLEGAVSLPASPPISSDWAPCSLITFDEGNDNLSYSLT